MIITSALVSGFQKEISQKVFGFWGHIHIMSSEVLRSMESVPITNDDAFKSSLYNITPEEVNGIPREDISPISGGIDHIQVFVNKPGIIQTKRELEGIILKGVGKDYNWDFFQRYMEDGELIAYDDDSMSDDILVSATTANRLQIGVGEKIIIHFVRDNRQIKRRFEVSGIYKTGLQDYDKKIALVDIRQLQQLNGWENHEISGYEIILDDVMDSKSINNHIYYEYLPVSLFSETIVDKDPSIFQWIALQDKNRTVIISLMVIVAIINLITTLLILILERTKMIGVLRSLGMQVSSLRSVFLLFALRILLKGLVIGNLLGIGICLLQKRFGFIKLSEEDYYLSTAPIHLVWPWIAALNLGTIIVVLICLILPTMLISRIDPVRAIRFN